MDSKTPTDMDTEIVMDTAMTMDNAMVPAPDTPMDDEPTSPETQQPSKRRRKKSVVWEHFTVETIGPGHTRACCKQCKKSFAYINGPKLAGTSHLKRHIALGICPAGRQNGELSPYTAVTSSGGYANATDPPKKRRYRITPPIPSSPLDQERCSQEVAKMIILHEYPLHIVEHPGFIDLVRTLQPQYNLVSFNTIQGDCVGIYLKEKQKLLDLISSIPGHVNLTLDVWTSNQTLGYVFLSGHFIDSDWKVHRHLLNVVMVSEPDSEHAFNQAVVACISDWSLDSGLFTLTLDETASSGSAIGNLRGLLCVKNPLVIDGQLVVGSCFARVLSRVAQEAIGSLQGTVKKIRDSVKYVKTSEANDEKFDELKQHLQVPSTKELCVDDRNKWNTTYNMLVAALELKEVFACFDASDPSYKLSPSMDDWKQVETLCSYLKHFYDAACTLTSAVPPTANIFFHEVSKIHLELAHAVMGQDPFVSNLVKPLHEKFEKYWKDSCLVLAIAVVMDPRFKMKLVEFNFQRIYGDDAESWIRLVEDGIHELYQDYSSPMLTHHQHQHQHQQQQQQQQQQHHDHAAPSENEEEEGIVKAEPPEIPPQEGMSHEEEAEVIAAPQEDEEGTTLITFGDGLSDFDVYISEITSGQETRSELDQYLEESLLPRVQEFDVLTWWKLNNIKYPTLSKMAADVLSIPMCSVPPEYVFDTKGRHIDSYRSSLRPVTLEALICTRDWLLHGSS